MINIGDNEPIYKEAIDHYGVDAQICMLVEECGELLSSISKFKRGRCNNFDVLTELADVSIMCEQLSLVYSDYDNFLQEKKRKINRLKDRLNGDNS